MPDRGESGPQHPRRLGRTALRPRHMASPPGGQGPGSRRRTAFDVGDGEVPPLHTAALRGKLETVSDLLDSLREDGKLGEVVNATDGQTKTPLHYAAELGDGDVVDLLLRNEARATLPDGKGKVAAELAATRGHIAVTEKLMAATEASDGDGPSGNQLLLAAADAGQMLLLQHLLLARKVSPNGDQGKDLPTVARCSQGG